MLKDVCLVSAQAASQLLRCSSRKQRPALNSPLCLDKGRQGSRGGLQTRGGGGVEMGHKLLWSAFK